MSKENDKPMTVEQAVNLTDMMAKRKSVPEPIPISELPEPTDKSHKELFVREVGVTARYGKAVYIRKEFHERIQRIVQTIGKNEVTLYSYIDNVLAAHFEKYQQEITKEYKDSIGKIY